MNVLEAEMVGNSRWMAFRWGVVQMATLVGMVTTLVSCSKDQEKTSPVATEKPKLVLDFLGVTAEDLKRRLTTAQSTSDESRRIIGVLLRNFIAKIPSDTLLVQPNSNNEQKMTDFGRLDIDGRDLLKLIHQKCQSDSHRELDESGLPIEGGFSDGKKESKGSVSGLNCPIKYDEVMTFDEPVGVQDQRDEQVTIRSKSLVTSRFQVVDSDLRKKINLANGKEVREIHQLSDIRVNNAEEGPSIQSDHILLRGNISLVGADGSDEISGEMIVNRRAAGDRKTIQVFYSFHHNKEDLTLGFYDDGDETLHYFINGRPSSEGEILYEFGLGLGFR